MRSRKQQEEIVKCCRETRIFGTFIRKFYIWKVMEVYKSQLHHVWSRIVEIGGSSKTFIRGRRQKNPYIHFTTIRYEKATGIKQ